MSTNIPERYRGHHPLDALDAKKLRELVKAKKIRIDLRDKSPEAIALRKRLGKLKRIARHEAEACGEEFWGV